MRLACRSSGIRPTLARIIRAGSAPASSMSSTATDPAGRVPHAREHLDQLGLPVAGDPGDPQDLARADVERHVRQRGELVRAGRVQAPDAEDRLARRGRRIRGTLDAERWAADHHAGQLALVGRARGRADEPPTAEHADAVADGPHLGQLVADEDDRQPVGHERSQRGEERVHLVGDQDRRRLVEDEDAAVARQRLQDLDPLLLPDRQLIHASRRIDADSEAVRCIRRAAPGLGQVEAQARRATEREVLGDRHRPHQREVLGHHPDPRVDRVARGSDATRLPIDQDLTGIGLREPVGDAHDRGLAGPVLAEQRVDLAATDVEVDAVVGDEVPEPLADAAQLQGRRAVGHATGPATRRGWSSPVAFPR